MGEQKEKFTWNKKYLSMCLYGIIFVLASVLIIKAIMDWSTTAEHLKRFFAMLGPFIWGAFIAFLVNPMVGFFSKTVFGRFRFFRRKDKLRNGLSLFLAYVLILCVLVLVIVYLAPQIGNSISDIINKAPTWVEQVNDWLLKYEEDHPNIDFESINSYIEDFVPQLKEKSQKIVTGIVPFIFSTSLSVMKVLVNTLIAIMVSIYIISDKKILASGFKKVLYGLIPDDTANTIMDTIRECNHIFSQFVFGKAVDSFIIGSICFIVLTILQMPFTPIISLIVGITNMIPYFGPFIGAIPGVILVFMVNPLQSLIFIVVIVVLQQFDGLFLGPRILGETVGLRPLWIIFAITIGGSLSGVIGMFLGVPVVAVFSYLLDKLLDRLDKKRKAKQAIARAQAEAALREKEAEEVVVTPQNKE